LGGTHGHWGKEQNLKKIKINFIFMTSFGSHIPITETFSFWKFIMYIFTDKNLLL
jgi:hypothetical protein